MTYQVREADDDERSWVALCVDGIVFGVGKTEAQARKDAAPWLAETDRTIDEHSDDEIEYVDITEYQASLVDLGHVDTHTLIRRPALVGRTRNH